MAEVKDLKERNRLIRNDLSAMHQYSFLIKADLQALQEKWAYLNPSLRGPDELSSRLQSELSINREEFEGTQLLARAEAQRHQTLQHRLAVKEDEIGRALALKHSLRNAKINLYGKMASAQRELQMLSQNKSYWKDILEAKRAMLSQQAVLFPTTQKPCSSPPNSLLSLNSRFKLDP